MAKFVLKDASVVVNGVDLSDHVIDVTVNQTVAIADGTAMGASGKGKMAGLGDDKFTVKFLSDFAAAKVDATLAPLVRAAAFTVVVKPTSAAVSATNPTYTGSCILSDYTPIGGSVGDRAEAPVTFEVDGIIARATA